MTYSCSDFTDTVLDALGVVVPPEDQDDPSAQADLALAAIGRLKAGPSASMVEALDIAESFMSGFEDDDTQEESVDDMLVKIRAAQIEAHAHPIRGPLYVCAIETKYIEDWRLFRTEDAARAHLQATAQKTWDDVGGTLWEDRDEDADLDLIEWFQGRDSTYTATIQELTVEG